MISRRQSKPLLLRNDRWRDRLEQSLDGLSSEITPDECHEIRESLCRLATWLKLAGFRSLRERVKSLRRAIGPLRDLDVVRERIGASDRVALDQERRRRAESARSRLLGAITQTLLDDLREAPVVNYAAAEREARRLARRVEKAGARFVAGTTREHAHRLRRRLRDCRFAREWLGLTTSGLKPLIRRLGQLSDEVLVRPVLDDLNVKDNGAKDHGADSDSADRLLKESLAEWKSLRGKIRPWSRPRDRSLDGR